MRKYCTSVAPPHTSFIRNLRVRTLPARANRTRSGLKYTDNPRCGDCRYVRSGISLSPSSRPNVRAGVTDMPPQ